MRGESVKKCQDPNTGIRCFPADFQRRHRSREGGVLLPAPEVSHQPRPTLCSDYWYLQFTHVERLIVQLGVKEAPHTLGVAEAGGAVAQLEVWEALPCLCLGGSEPGAQE